MYSPESSVRKTGSYIYEEFMPTDGTDVKVFMLFTFRSGWWGGGSFPVYFPYDMVVQISSKQQQHGKTVILNTFHQETSNARS